MKAILLTLTTFILLPLPSLAITCYQDCPPRTDTILNTPQLLLEPDQIFQQELACNHYKNTQT